MRRRVVIPHGIDGFDMSMIPSGTMVVVADGRQARVFRNYGDTRSLKLQQDEALDAEIAHGNGPSGVQPKDNDVGEAAFAKTLADRINQAALRHRFDHIVLVADPATLGEMRPQLHHETKQRMLAEVAKDWTNEPLEKVEKALFDLRIG